MSYSRDGGVTITRICGMVGVGKTTLDEKIGQKTGDSVDTPSLHRIAKDIVKEYQGFPLAFITVAGALKRKSKPSWEDVLLQLQRSAPKNIPGVIKNVYQSLKLSYDYLESNEVKYLFFLCSLFEEDSNIWPEELLRYGVGLLIFWGVENLEEARKRVCLLLETLKDNFLLSQDSGKNYVKMHDVVRDVAISITSEEEHIYMRLSNLKMLCLSNLRLDDISIIGELVTLEILSIRDSRLEELPVEMGKLTNALKERPTSGKGDKDSEKSESSKDSEKSRISDEEWEELDMKVESQIRLCLAKYVLTNVIGLSTTKELWEKLEELYQTKSISNRLYLKEQFHKLQMAEGTTISGYLSVLNGIVSELESIGVKIDDERQDTSTHLEKRLKNGDEKSLADSALVVKGKWKQSSKKKVICWNCKQPGHVKNNCPNNGASSVGSSKENAANVVSLEQCNLGFSSKLTRYALKMGSSTIAFPDDVDKDEEISRGTHIRPEKNMVQVIKFPNLYSIKLQSLECFTHFCSDTVEGIEFPLLQIMLLWGGLPEFQNFWPTANHNISNSNPLFTEKVCFYCSA
ncbi:putative leucine-rich repeat receptor-like protein kinase-like [Capsicum annuum]|nr:putative leucine-rich repeat receptor-like protein kinase-like [Capsicum annuum]